MKQTHKLLSILLCCAMLLGMLPMTAMARTVIPVEPDGGMNLQIDKYGKLLWDSVDGATGYTVDICKYPGDFLLTTDSVGAGETSYALFSKLDDLGYDNGTYRVKINVSGSDPAYTYSTLLFYYDSPYEELSPPANLRWNGNTAEWDAVPDADYYNVYIRNTTTTGGLSVRSNLTATSVDLSYLSPEAGWYFEVIAYSTGYRNSAVSESPRKDGGSRTILPVSEDGAMNLKLLENGMLLWDKYDDATSYTVEVFEHPGTFVLKTISVDKANQYCNLIDEMDEECYDNGDYRIEVTANGSSAEHSYDSMIIYYDSPYKKLTTPANVEWNGLFAEWDAVPGAQYYNVYVNDPTTGSLKVKSHVEDNFVALTEFDPQPGWYFEVIAYGNGYRYSAAGVSPRKGFIVGADTYNASLDEPYSGGKVKVETTAGSHDYSYVGESFEVRAGTEVAMTAQPDDGYEFVEWRIGSETGEPYSKSKSIGFRADESLRLFAVFHKSIPEGMGTINNPVVCSTYEEMKYALEHPTVQGIVVNSFTNDLNQDFYTLQKEKDFKAGHCAITVPTGTTKYLTINADIDIRVPYVDYLLYSFIDVRGSLIVGGTGTLGVSMNARGYPSAILFNNGTLEVGGTITLDPSNKSFDSMHGYSVINASGKTVIYGGTFVGYSASAMLYQGGSMEIYGGDFQVVNGDDQAFGLNTDTYLSVAEHDVALYGGTFEGIRADQSTGANIVKLPDLLAYGAYYVSSSGDEFDPAGLNDTHEKLTVKMKNIVDEIALTIDPPTKDATPDQYATMMGTGYQQALNGVQWQVSSDGSNWSVMGANDTYAVGMYYRVFIDLKAANDYLFAVDSNWEPTVSATVNGKSAEVFRYPEENPDELIFIRCDFGMLNDVYIPEIRINDIVEPKAGQTPSYTCTVGGNGYTINTAYSDGTTTINGIFWYDMTDPYNEYAMNPMYHTFELGGEYKVVIDVKTEDGFEFSTEKVGNTYMPAGTGYINGNLATIGNPDDGRYEQNVQYIFTCGKQEISTIMLYNLDEPVGGNAPDTQITAAYPEYYSVQSVTWTDIEGGAVGATFETGVPYQATIVVKAQTDVYFTDNPTVYIDGNQPNSNNVSVNNEKDTVTIVYTFSKPASAPEVSTGTAVSGTVKAYNSGSAPVVKLYASGVEKYTAQIGAASASGNQYTWDFTFEGVAMGYYDLVVTKDGHLAYTIEDVLVTGPTLDLTANANAAISTISMLCGDINGDGSINTTDINIIYQADNYYQSAAAAATPAADLDGDGSINTSDINIIYQTDNYYKGTVDCTVAY